jgi:signal transduction histidine kinase
MSNVDQATRGVLNIARSLLSDVDSEAVLHRVLESAREITGAYSAVFGVLDDSQPGSERFLIQGIDGDQQRTIASAPSALGVSSEPSRTFPIVVDGQPFGNLYLAARLDGVEFTVEDDEAVSMLAEFAGVAIEHARRTTSSEEHRHRLQQTVAALDATMQIAHALGGQTDVEAILTLVAKRGRTLVSARTLVIELQQGDELVMRAGAGELPAGLVGQRVAMRDTVAAAALSTRQSQRLSSEVNRHRFWEHGAGRLGLSASDGLVVPMVFRNQNYGVLVALDRLDGTGEFTPEDQRLLEAFAASAATAVATATTAADERRRQALAATEAERARWARELHDETLQSMANLRLLLAGAGRRGKPEGTAAALTQAVDQLGSDIANLRALIADLRPASLDEIGLGAGLTALSDRFDETGVELDMDVSLAWEQGRASSRLTNELETAIYRVVQESLTNATKHGHAGRIAVEVIESKTVLTATVRDDGEGFDPLTRTDGFGLIGMRERVDLLSGDLLLHSSPGHGTTVTVTLPVRRAVALGRPAR